MPAKIKIIPVMKNGFRIVVDRFDKSILVPRFHIVRTIDPIITKRTPNHSRVIQISI
jgi:hypothetical protein